MFTGLYADEVAGLVYVDPSPMPTLKERVAKAEVFGSSRDFSEKSSEGGSSSIAGVRSDGRCRISPKTEVLIELADTDFAAFRDLLSVPDVPVVLLIAGGSDPPLRARERRYR